MRGHFHAAVPEEVRLAYEPAEHVLALAWYHWPLYDVGLRQVLGVFEMAVRFRAEELGIELATSPKNGKQREKNLGTLIDQVVKAEPEKYDKEWLESARRLRNFYAHPQAHSYMGAHGRNKVIVTVNLINELFLPATVVSTEVAELNRLRTAYASFRDGFFVLEQEQRRILVCGAYPLQAFRRGEEWVYVWCFYPVLTDTYQALAEHRIPSPLVRVIKGFSVADDVFSGADLASEEPVTLTPTNHPANQAIHTRYEQDLAKLEQRDRNIYVREIGLETTRVVNALIHSFRWQPSPSARAVDPD